MRSGSAQLSLWFAAHEGRSPLIAVSAQTLATSIWCAHGRCVGHVSPGSILLICYVDSKKPLPGPGYTVPPYYTVCRRNQTTLPGSATRRIRHGPYGFKSEPVTQCCLHHLPLVIPELLQL